VSFSSCYNTRIDGTLLKSPSNELMDELTIFSRRLMIIVGIFMYVFGSIGNLLNIYVFYAWSRSRKSLSRYSNGYRSKNSSLYLLTSSISNLIVIIYPLLTRIIFDGFKYSVDRKHVFLWCQLRFSLLHTFDLISLTSICLATFDRYLITCRKVRFRHLIPTRKQTKQMIFVIVCFFSIHSIPIGYYFDVTNCGQCRINSRIYLYYYLWTTQIFFRGIIPILFLSIVCLLTFKQLNKLERNQLKLKEKQFSRMLLLISLAIVLSSIPYCIEHVYYVMFSNDYIDKQSSNLYFYHIISSILFYTNSVTSFYIFYISTPNFRAQIRKLFLGERNFGSMRIMIIAQSSRRRCC